MKVVISGGFGYLGQRLGKYFHDNGCIVFLGSRSKRNKPLWLTNGEVFITDWKNIHSCFYKIKSADLFIHCAGMNASQCLHNKEEAKIFNGSLTEKIIEASIEIDIKDFLYLSTAHVYSDPLQGVISEDSKLTNNHPYAKSNALGEKYVFQANKSKKINAKVVRLSNCFGAPLDIKTKCWHLAVNNFCLQAIENQEIILESCGKELRDFIPISEFCRVLDFIIKNCMRDSENSVFNIGGKTLSISDIANIVSEVYEKKYNKKIKIKTNTKDLKKEAQFFDYKMNWIKGYQFEKIFNPYTEINDLLDLCKENTA